MRLREVIREYDFNCVPLLDLKYLQHPVRHLQNAIVHGISKIIAKKTKSGPVMPTNLSIERSNLRKSLCVHPTSRLGIEGILLLFVFLLLTFYRRLIRSEDHYRYGKLN